jgi:hypothetical protein
LLEVKSLPPPGCEFALTRRGDKGQIAKLQKTRWLLQRYKQDRTSNFEIIDACHLEFALQSQTSANKWYIVNLSQEWCKCNDHGPICKYMWALKIIIEEEFQYLLDLLPSAYEPHGFIHDNEEYGPDGGPDGGADGGSDRGPNGRPDGGVDGRWDGGPDDDVRIMRRDVQVVGLYEIKILMTITRIEGLSQEQYDKVDIATKLIWSFYKELQIQDQDQGKFRCQGKVEVSHLFKLMLPEQDLVLDAKKRKEN